jgi:aminoglycoside phosphotransferase (APT) family kinase protein
MPQSAFNFDEGVLACYLEDHMKGFRGPLTAEKFTGGQSIPTFLLIAGSGKYVLRRKPSGELIKSAHAVDREFRVISALANSEVPVANAYHLCVDDAVIGSMFYIMEYVDGRVMWDPALPGFEPSQRKAIYSEMNCILATVHSVDIEAVGLSDYGNPSNYFERQIGRWSKQYRASETETIAAMEALMAWLPNNRPSDDGRVCLVHGDFRIDNMMFHPSEPSTLALLDWEFSTLGHPFADLAHQCMQLRVPHDCAWSGLGGIDRDTLGIPSEEAYIAEYCERMKIDRIPDWNFYLIFSFFRFASMLQCVKKRSLEGNASSQKAMEIVALPRLLAEMAVQQGRIPFTT